MFNFVEKDTGVRGGKREGARAKGGGVICFLEGVMDFLGSGVFEYGCNDITVDMGDFFKGPGEGVAFFCFCFNESVGEGAEVRGVERSGSTMEIPFFIFSFLIW